MSNKAITPYDFSVSQGSSGVDSHLLEPKYNLRETAKQLLALEDHLAQDKKRCQSCLQKHCLMAEMFIEEAYGLDTKNEYTAVINNTLENFRNIEHALTQDIKDGTLSDWKCRNYAQRLRAIRKPLVQMTYDLYCH